MLDERSLTKGEDKKKEKYVKGMKKSFSDFKSRYGDDAKSVMYATATKMAKEQNLDKFDRTVRAAGAAKNPQTKIKLLKVAAQQRPKVAEGYYDSAVQASKDASKTKEAKAGRRNLRVQQTKDTVKKGVQAVGKKVTADAAKAMVGGKVQKGPVAASSKPAAKTASPTTTAVTKSQPGMQSKRAPSIPKKPETPKDTQNTQKPQEPKTPQKKKEVNKNAKQGKAGETAKKLGQSAAKAVGGFAAMFDPKESYEQEGELLTFSDFREIVAICVANEEELNELLKPRGDATPVKPIGPGGSYVPVPFGPVQKFVKKKQTTQVAHYEPEGEQLQEKPGDGYLGPTPIPNPIRLAKDAVDAYNRKNQKTVDTVNKTLGRNSASMPKVKYFNKGPSAASQRYLGLKANESAAWTRKAGKNSEGGLNEKGRKSYEKENPGSDLTAPSKKVGNPRRASFCARMKGMKKKLTSKKTASDPDSRINKSLRAWNC